VAGIVGWSAPVQRFVHALLGTRYATNDRVRLTLSAPAIGPSGPRSRFATGGDRR